MSSIHDTKSHHCFKGTVPGWQIVTIIGRGHNGQVYSVREIAKPHRTGVIKVFCSNNDEASEKAFNRDKEIVESQLIPGEMSRFYGSGTVGDYPYFIMERLDDLPDIITLNQFVRIALDLIDNVELLANKRLYHNDIKPNNIGFKNGKARLFDFDAASRFDERMDFRIRAGTGHYMAPEVRTEGNVSLLSEFYSLGVTLRELCPKEGEYIFDNVLSRATSTSPELRPQTPEVFRKMILSAVPDFKRKVAKESRVKKVAIRCGIAFVSFVIIALTVISIRNADYNERKDTFERKVNNSTANNHTVLGIHYYLKGDFANAYINFWRGKRQTSYNPTIYRGYNVETMFEDCCNRLRDTNQ